MVSGVMTKKSSVKNTAIDHIRIISILVLSVKVLGTFFINTGAFLGADTESYVAQVEALNKEGFFFQGLTTWPAGYAITIWVIQAITFTNNFVALSIIQSILWSTAVYFLSIELSKQKFSKIAIPTCYLLLLNPTLTLTSLTMGYESLCASFTILILVLLIKTFDSPQPLKYLLYASILMSFSIALQPRLVPGYLVALAIFSFNAFSSKKALIRTNILLIIIVLLLPTGLALRNHASNGEFTVSTNLGMNMLMGAGPGSTGRYSYGVSGLECSDQMRVTVETDNDKVFCALKWHLTHPVESTQLSLKKFSYLWSPWWGPTSTGTMARNPYLDFHPIKSSVQTKEDLQVVVGPLGVGISWIVVIGGWILLVLGIVRSFVIGGIERKSGLASAAMIASTSVVTFFTFGDNRYRLPILGLSILLQLFGISPFFKLLALMKSKKKFMSIFK
jgi:hypothetical protein